MRLPDKRILALGLVLALPACGAGGGESVLSTTVVPQGPAADYPMVIGDPFTIDGTLYTPADTLNYDEVGQLVPDQAGGTAISGEHRTLPLPSYVEVTSLSTGRTILVRLERRGPMAGKGLIGLSPGALEQLEATPGTAVRVRRVNPPEQERAMLRRGERAPQRMDTPMALVEVLRRKLPASGSAPIGVPEKPAHAEESAPSHQVEKAPVPKPEKLPPAKPEKAPLAKVAPAEKKPPAPTKPPVVTARPEKGGYAVQAGAFSVQSNAKSVAAKISGTISRAGQFYIVRTGPFANRKEAEASLAKVKAAGYSGARIYSVE